MEKETEKEKNIIITETLSLKVNLSRVKNGTEKNMIEIKN